MLVVYPLVNMSGTMQFYRIAKQVDYSKLRQRQAVAGTTAVCNAGSKLLQTRFNEWQIGGLTAAAVAWLAAVSSARAVSSSFIFAQKLRISLSSVWNLLSMFPVIVIASLTSARVDCISFFKMPMSSRSISTCLRCHSISQPTRHEGLGKYNVSCSTQWCPC